MSAVIGIMNGSASSKLARGNKNGIRRVLQSQIEYTTGLFGLGSLDGLNRFGDCKPVLVDGLSDDGAFDGGGSQVRDVDEVLNAGDAAAGDDRRLESL